MQNRRQIIIRAKNPITNLIRILNLSIERRTMHTEHNHHQQKAPMNTHAQLRADLNTFEVGFSLKLNCDP